MISSLTSSASESVFEQTPMVSLRLKHPRQHVLVKRSQVPYFESNNLFMPLFVYHYPPIAATPVEVGIQPEYFM